MVERLVLCGVMLLGAMPPLHAAGTAGLALARANACLGCHKVDGRMVGPPLQEIGARYAKGGDRDATIAYLAKAIREGGRGRWGAIPMPAQPQVDEQEAADLAKWVLGLAADD